MKRALTATEAKALFAAASRPRERSMIVLLWRAGLRIAEACQVEPQDLLRDDFGTKVHIRSGKGGKSRYVGLDERSVGILRSSGIEFGPFLQTSSGRPMDTSQARRRLPQIARAAGIRGRLHPHMLRHTYAVELYREGVGVRDIQTLLGHESLDTTAVYLEGLGCHVAVRTSAGRTW